MQHVSGYAKLTPYLASRSNLTELKPLTMAGLGGRLIYHVLEYRFSRGQPFVGEDGVLRYFPYRTSCLRCSRYYRVIRAAI